jgi:PKD repeat protein
MKLFYACLILITTIVVSCQKDKSTTNSTTVSPTQTVAVKPPTANFKISNAISSGSVWEELPLNFTNVSQNADSYYWDFGNGITSTDKAPSNISLAPCGFTYTISLTVKNKNGQSSTYSAPFAVVCSRGMGYGAHGQ